MFFITLVSSVFAMLPIIFMQQTVDAIYSDNPLSDIIKFGSIYLFLQLLGNVLRQLKLYFTTYYQLSIAERVRNNIFDGLFLMRLEELNEFSAHEAFNILIKDTDFIEKNIFNPLINTFEASILFLIGLVYVSSINIYLTIILIPLGLLTTYIAKKVEMKTENNILTQRHKASNLEKKYREGIYGIKILKIFDSTRFYSNLVKTSNEDLTEASLSQVLYENYAQSVVSLVFMLSIGAVLIVTSIMVGKGLITIGAMISVLMYNHMLTDPLIEIIRLRTESGKLSVSIERIIKLQAFRQNLMMLKQANVAIFS